MKRWELGGIVLPPSMIWHSHLDYGVEWMLWPEPTEAENTELEGLKVRYPDPIRGNICWERDDLIYLPRDMIAALTLPEDIRDFILGESSAIKMKEFLDKNYFSLQTLKIITSILPLGQRMWDVPYPKKPYPDNLMRKVSKWTG